MSGNGQRRRRLHFQESIVSFCYCGPSKQGPALRSRYSNRLWPKVDCWTKGLRIRADVAVDRSAKKERLLLGRLVLKGSRFSTTSNNSMPQPLRPLQPPRSVAGRCAGVASAGGCWPIRLDCPSRRKMDPTDVDDGPVSGTGVTIIPN